MIREEVKPDGLYMYLEGTTLYYRIPKFWLKREALSKKKVIGQNWLKERAKHDKTIK